jgi:hypothetical protein
MRTWTRLALTVLFVTPFTLLPAHAGEAEMQEIETLKKKLEAHRRAIEDLRNEVNQLQSLAAELRIIHQKLDGISQQVTRQSRYFDPNGQNPPNGGAPVPGKGAITLRNQYTAAATFRINDRTYTVQPGNKLTVTGVPVGTVTFEVSVDGYGVVQRSTAVSLTERGRTINVFPLQSE